MTRRVRAQLVLATAAAVGTTFGVQGIAAALPAIQRELHLSDSELGLLTAVYMVPAVAFAIPLGYLSDRLGRRKVFVSMALLWGFTGLAQAWANSLEVMLVLRFLQGVGFAALMPLSITLIGDVLRGAAQLRAQSRRQVAMTFGELALPLVGAGLAALAWNAPLVAQGGALFLALGGLLLLDDRRSEMPSQGYARELTAAVRQPGMPAVLTAGYLRFIGKFAIIAYLPFMLVHRGATLAQAAIVMSAGSGVAALTSTQVVRMLRWAPASRLLLGGVVIVGFSLMGYAAAPTWEIALVAAVVYGMGDGVLMVLQNALVTEAAPPAVRGGVIAVSGMTRNAGKLFAPLAMGALLFAVDVPLAFVAMGVITLALVPVLLGARELDGLLTPKPPGLVPVPDPV
jgi:ACDE family multidrug resistance protein